MIRYTLRCEKGHAFESWFQSSAAYESQRKRRLVACPSCDSVKVDKAIMAPQIARKGTMKDASAESKPQPSAPATSASLMMAHERELRAKLRELRDHVTKTADDVGKKFPEEARKMHYGEIAHRPIYGEASAHEAKAMIDEGLDVSPLPMLPDDRN